jgi:plastocyanin
MNIDMEYEIKSCVAITLLLTGFVGIVTDTTSKVASATSATSPASTITTQPTLSGEVQSIYDNHRLATGEDVKNLVILLPNEAHHGPGEEDESRFIDQPFVPDIAVISPGTNVFWFNGDAGHEHNIVVQDNATGQNLYQTGEFTEFEIRNQTFNEVGEYSYEDTVEYDQGYRMRGNVIVEDQVSSPLTSELYDTVGILMVPTMDLATQTTDLQGRGLSILGTHNFKDLRGGQEGSGDEQTLILWGTSNMDVGNVLTQLAEISQELPYS